MQDVVVASASYNRTSTRGKIDPRYASFLLASSTRTVTVDCTPPDADRNAD